MAQDSSNAVKNDIDLDDLEVEILVIAKQPKNLAQTAAFLSRRGWPTTVLSDFSKALEFAAEKKPDIVVISLNHGNPALQKFADLMSTTFKATCVAFIETMDTASNAKLNRSNFKHKVVGRASGPTFQRAIRKVLAEKFNIVDEKSAPEPAAKKEKTNFTVKGEKNSSASGSDSIIQKSGQGPAGKKGPTFIKGEASGEHDGDDGNAYTGSGDYDDSSVGGAQSSSGRKRKTLAEAQAEANANGAAQQGHGKGSEIGYGGSSATSAGSTSSSGPASGSAGSDSDINAIANSAENSLNGGRAPSAAKGNAAAAQAGEEDTDEVVSTGKYTMKTKNRRSLKEMAAAGYTANDPNAPTSEEDPDVLAAKLKQSLFGGTAGEDHLAKKAAEANAANNAFTSSDPNSPPAFSGAENKGTTVGYDGSNAKSSTPNFSGSISKEKIAAEQMADSLSNNPNQIRPEDLGKPRAESLDAEIELFAGNEELKTLSLIEKAVMGALMRICQSSEEPTALEAVDQVGVFPVDSPSMPGYLVIAWPHEVIATREAFFKLAQDTLQSVFAEMGVKAKLEPGFFVQLPVVEFMNWTAEKANFTFSLPHGPQELGVAFFSSKEPLPKARQLEDQAMYSIKLDHISTEQPVNFKAYLHLKKNRKYFLYLRNGRQLAPEQKARLKNKHVADLSVKSVDIENLRMFLAACFLRDTLKGSDEAA